MFKRIYHRFTHTATHPQATTTVPDPVQLTAQEGNRIVPDTETMSGEGQGGNEPPAKRTRFELGPEINENTWELPPSLLDYVHKYMGLHIADKVIDDQILHNSPVPSNLRKAPQLDTYIKKLLQDNAKFTTLKHERTLRLMQDKLWKVFGPLTQLWAAIEGEKAQSPEDEALESISTSFYQSIMLLAQVFNSLSHHRRENIISALMDSQTRVKEILKTQSNHKIPMP